MSIWNMHIAVTTYLKEWSTTINFLISFFHSYLGFCTELSNPFSPGLTTTSNIILTNKTIMKICRKCEKVPLKVWAGPKPYGLLKQFWQAWGCWYQRRGSGTNHQHDILQVCDKIDEAQRMDEQARKYSTSQ